MMKTLTENRLQGQLRAVLDYVVNMKEPVVVARDEGNAIIIPQEIYEAAEAYLHRTSVQNAMPRAIPQFEQEAFPPQTEETPKRQPPATKQPDTETHAHAMDGRNLREIVAARIAQQLQANHIQMSDEAFSKLVDETLQEIESSGDMSFLEDFDRENAAMQTDARTKQGMRSSSQNDEDDELYHFGRH